MEKRELDYLEFIVTGACIEVHKTLGPGLLKSVYKKCLMREFLIREVRHISNVNVSVDYKNLKIETELRVDFYIENVMILEIKAVDEILAIHKAEILACMKLMKAPKGLLVNFNCSNIVKEGKIPFVNEYYRMITDSNITT